MLTLEGFASRILRPSVDRLLVGKGWAGKYTGRLDDRLLPVMRVPAPSRPIPAERA